METNDATSSQSSTTTWHCHFELDYLMAQPDNELSKILTGGPISWIRTQLVLMKAAGKTVLVAGPCDHKNPDGSCAGHRKEK